MRERHVRVWARTGFEAAEWDSTGAAASGLTRSLDCVSHVGPRSPTSGDAFTALPIDTARYATRRRVPSPRGLEHARDLSHSAPSPGSLDGELEEISRSASGGGLEGRQRLRHGLGGPRLPDALETVEARDRGAKPMRKEGARAHARREPGVKPLDARPALLGLPRYRWSGPRWPQRRRRASSTLVQGQQI
jgi:hypothetical protein